MNELDMWVWQARPLFTLLIVLCVLAQTLATVLSCLRRRGGFGWFMENLLEALVLGQVTVCSLLPGQLLYRQAFNEYVMNGQTLNGQVINGHFINGQIKGLLSDTGFSILRIVVFIALVLAVATACAAARKPRALLVAAAAFLTLPLMEAFAGSIFVYLYIAELFIFLARGLRVCIIRNNEIKTGLSALSIKNAIDSLHTGVAYSEPNGYILLANAQMLRLMTSLTGKVCRNGNRFYDMLISADVKPGCEKTRFGNQIVYLLPGALGDWAGESGGRGGDSGGKSGGAGGSAGGQSGGSAWMFTRTELHIKRKKYIQLTAADITERWKLTADLSHKDELLKQKQAELTRTIENLHTLSREKVRQTVKIRAHDILGERLALLLRSISSGRYMDFELLRSLTHGLIEDLKGAPLGPSPRDELDNLKQVFGTIGVAIETSGELPKDATKAKLFADIAREAISNAVKHGFATMIRIEMEETIDSSRMRISNNGEPPPEVIREGGGLSGMRKMAEPFDGVLSFGAFPHFVLSIELPANDNSLI